MKHIIFIALLFSTLSHPIFSMVTLIKTIEYEDYEFNDVVINHLDDFEFLYVIKSKKGTGTTKFDWNKKTKKINFYRASFEEKEKYVYTIDIWDIREDKVKFIARNEHCCCEPWESVFLSEKNPQDDESFDHRTYIRCLNFYDRDWRLMLEVDFDRDKEKIVWSQDFKKSSEELTTLNKEGTLFVSASSSEIKIFKKEE